MKIIFGLFVSLILVALFIVPIIGSIFVPWKIFDYSDGERTGLVNEISHKGLICKTYEGHILVGNGQNIQPEEFDFTVKDEDVVKELEQAQGKIATLSYRQYGVTSSCWGNTDYEITGVQIQ